MKKSYGAIDIAKFIGAFLVLTVHCDIGALPTVLVRWAVPFFFISSAFFLFGKSKNGNIDSTVLKRYVIRIAALYGLWFIFNLPSVYYHFFFRKDIGDINIWLDLFKSAVLGSTFLGSWYLASSIFSAVFVFLLSKKLSTKAVMAVSSLFYLACIMISCYCSLLPAAVQSFLWSWVFPQCIFQGLFFFAIGKYISENKEAVLAKISKKKALIGFVACYLVFLGELFITERFALSNGSEASFATPFMALFLFLLCIQADFECKQALLLRKLSVIIYCCHSIIVDLNWVTRRAFGLSAYTNYFLSIAAVAAVCAVVLFVQKKFKWKWTEYLT